MKMLHREAEIFVFALGEAERKKKAWRAVTKESAL
jgi:hypothetical protein